MQIEKGRQKKSEDAQERINSFPIINASPSIMRVIKRIIA